MAEHIVTDEHGRFLMNGDVINHRGIAGVFERVVGHDPEGGGMLIVVDGEKSYADFWGVYVEEIADEPEFDEDDEEEAFYGSWYPEDYEGYDVRDEYYEDLYGEGYEQDDIY